MGENQNKKARPDFRETLNSLVTIIAEHIGLQEITFLIDFDRKDSDTYSASMENADYSHLSCRISCVLSMKEKLYDDPDAFARLLMHEMLHYATDSGNSVMRQEWDTLKYYLGELTLTLHYNKSVAFAEQNTIRLERAFIKSLWDSDAYADWKYKLKSIS